MMVQRITKKILMSTTIGTMPYVFIMTRWLVYPVIPWYGLMKIKIIPTPMPAVIIAEKRCAMEKRVVIMLEHKPTRPPVIMATKNNNGAAMYDGIAVRYGMQKKLLIPPTIYAVSMLKSGIFKSRCVINMLTTSGMFTPIISIICIRRFILILYSVKRVNTVLHNIACLEKFCN